MSPMTWIDTQQAGLSIGPILDKMGRVQNSVGGTLALASVAFSIAARGRLGRRWMDRATRCIGSSSSKAAAVDMAWRERRAWEVLLMWLWCCFIVCCLFLLSCHPIYHPISSLVFFSRGSPEQKIKIWKSNVSFLSSTYLRYVLSSVRLINCHKTYKII